MSGERVERGRRGMWATALVVLLAAGCVTAWRPPAQPYHRVAPIADAELEGVDECLACHDDPEEHTPGTEYHADCESCHGPGSVHVESEEPTDVRYPASADCLGCHEKGRQTHMGWSTGQHERAGVICSDCHNPHNQEPLHVRQAREPGFGYLDSNSKLCIGCHTAVAARLNYPSHHPVREGMMSCTDCHDVHGDRRTALGDRTQVCAGCHQDHAGPWIFEHLPSSEACTTCHDPHGTASANLLETMEPVLCISCHTVPAFHSVNDSGLYYTRCTDCHGAIHGSYESRRLMR